MEDDRPLAKTVLSSGNDMEATRVPASAPSSEAAVTLGPTRTTVLPRIEQGERLALCMNKRERYEEIAPLGKGGMGEVVLLRDHDIEREVALKRLPSDAGVEALMRFVDEIHTVGQLEHPNIVPVHDVGLDERGRYFFVMKRLQGQTLEAIIDRLRAGDPEAHARYTFSARVQIFLGILHAMSYAHKQGFIHRDLKPANVMVGPFGEVTVMDWGLAKRLHAPELPAPPPRPAAAGESQPAATALARSRTQVGQVMGTPFYMSPEQIRGEVDKIDERTDTYALTVVLHELMTLEHYLEGRETLEAIAEGIQTASPPLRNKHPSQPVIPPDIAWFIIKGMAKDPSKRFQSVDEMIARLKRSLDGHILVQCPNTLVKRILQEVIAAADAHPYLTMLSLPTLAALLLGGIGVALLR